MWFWPFRSTDWARSRSVHRTYLPGHIGCTHQPMEVRVKLEDDRLVFEFGAELKAFETPLADAPALMHKTILIAEDSEINALVFSGSWRNGDVK